jgi:peptide deformylase
MSATALMEISTALADMAMLAEKNSAQQPVMLAALSEQISTIRALVDQMRMAPTVNVAAPTVNVASSVVPAPQVNVTAGETVVHVFEREIAAKKAKLTVHRNPSGFIESLDIEYSKG